MKDAFHDLVTQIVRHVSMHGGVTVDCRKQRVVELGDVWLYPKYPSKTLIIPSSEDLFETLAAYLHQYQKLLTDEDCYFGVWLNPKSQAYYLDINTTKTSKDDAITDAVARSKHDGRNIVSIYNPRYAKTIYLEKFF